MWEKVRGASIPLLSTLWMSVEVCILAFEDACSVFAFIVLFFIRRLVHLVFDVFPKDVALRELLQYVVPVLKALEFLK